ncbi:MAG: BON domain-containing protein [Acidobacteriota bacterium]|nr:BON domain-containing protein [Acidobacteriota bacterium]
MTRGLSALLTLFVASLFPIAASAQSEPVDLTAQFRSSGVDIADLQVYQINGIVLIRGTSADKVKAENAGIVAKNLGYPRVANLIGLSGAIRDVDIVRFAEGSLVRGRALEGCKFHIDSVNGIVTIGGSVYQEMQRDVAVDLLRKIDGVKEVRSTLKVL